MPARTRSRGPRRLAASAAVFSLRRSGCPAWSLRASVRWDARVQRSGTCRRPTGSRRRCGETGQAGRAAARGEQLSSHLKRTAATDLTEQPVAVIDSRHLWAHKFVGNTRFYENHPRSVLHTPAARDDGTCSEGAPSEAATPMLRARPRPPRPRGPPRLPLGSRGAFTADALVARSCPAPGPCAAPCLPRPRPLRPRRAAPPADDVSLRASKSPSSSSCCPPPIRLPTRLNLSSPCSRLTPPAGGRIGSPPRPPCRPCSQGVQPQQVFHHEHLTAHGSLTMR